MCKDWILLSNHVPGFKLNSDSCSTPDVSNLPSPRQLFVTDSCDILKEIDKFDLAFLMSLSERELLGEALICDTREVTVVLDVAKSVGKYLSTRSLRKQV